MDSEVMSTGVKSLPFISPSSPPPIDPTYTQDGDEDFGSFIGQDDAFDITGLSQKLATTLCKNDSSFCSSSILCEDNITLAEPSVKNSNIDLSVKSSNDNFSTVSTEIQGSMSLTPESLSIGTPPPFDCVGSVHEEHFNEGSPVHQIYSDKLDDDFEKSSVESEEGNEIPADCLQASLEENINFVCSSHPLVCNEREVTNDIGVSTFESGEIKDIEYEVENDEGNKINSISVPIDEPCISPSKVLSADESNFISNCYSQNSSEWSTNNKGSPITVFDDIHITCSPKHISDNFSLTNESCENNIKTTENCNDGNFLPESNDNYSCSEHDTQVNDLQFSDMCLKNSSHDIADEEVDSDFGDFADFETTKIDQVVQHDLNNDFADVSEEENSELEKELRNKIDMAINDDDDDDDDFGEFSSNADFNDEKYISENELKWSKSENDQFLSSGSNSNYFWKETFETRISQFDTLILKWVPLEPCFNEGISGGKSMQKLDEVIDGDAFIWHHLEDIDSCSALKLMWPSSQSNKFFLASLNVDARNIVSKDSMLFGHKWSSSVPLFAQTLSFSPLTPAKPSEVASANSWGIEERGSISQKLTDTTSENSWSIDDRGSAANKKNKLDASLRAGSTDSNAKDLENDKIIPPAKFDWSSSGLTNPLDTPGLEKEILNDSTLNVPAKMFTNEKGNIPSYLIEKIMQENQSRSQKTLLESLPLTVREVVKDLPDLNFMKAKVLMFPIRGDTDS